MTHTPSLAVLREACTLARVSLLAVTSALALLGCGGDSPVAPDVPFNPRTPELTGLSGTVVADRGFGQQGIFLQQQAGVLVLLHGYEAQPLASVDGADVIVRGSWLGGGQPLTELCLIHDHETPPIWDASPGFMVNDFTVVAVAGRSVIDGVLVETDGMYGVRYGGDEFYWFDDPPADLTDLVGERIWVSDTRDGAPLTFGVIAAA